MSTQVQLFSTPLSLISIPLQAYPYFGHGITKLILGTWESELKQQSSQQQLIDDLGSNHGSISSVFSKRQSRSEDNWNQSTVNSPNDPSSPLNLDDDRFESLQEFINVSITPVECSVICPTELVEILFGDAIKLLGEKLNVRVLKDEYLAIQVDSDGLDGGDRVLEVSSPIATAKIPLFFLATYFSDYVLVPVAQKDKVTDALQQRRFSYSESTNSYVSMGNSRNQGDEMPYSPSLIAQTFDLFQQTNVSAQFDTSSRLLLTGARTKSREQLANDSIHLTIIKILNSNPKYFSVTIASGSEISFLIDKDMYDIFPDNTLLGSSFDYVQPVTFDFRHLPEDSTGIVSGVASKLRNTYNIPLSYLSTAKSGVVMINEENMQVAIAALKT